MKYSLLPLVLILLFMISCGEDEVKLDCDTNANISINGKQACHTAVVTGYIYDIQDNRESIGIDLQVAEFSSTKYLSLTLNPQDGNLFTEGKTYDFKKEEGSGFSGTALGAVNSGSIKITKLDRENNLLSLEIKLDAEELPSNEPWKIQGTISDLPIIP